MQRSNVGGLAFLAGLLLLVPCLAAQPVESVKGYHDYSAAVSKLKELSAGHADEATLETIGKSAGGKDIHVITIAGKGEVAPEMRPGVFVGANMAGYHNVGTEAALHFIEYLLKSDDGRQMLADRIIYVAPILNPDAHEVFFSNPRTVTGGNAGKLDRDKDGFYQEDGMNDLNGDGMITRMRIQDPAGDMLPDPDNPFVMRKVDADKGESGSYRVLGEGGDDDGDGEYNEDHPSGIQPNRNFAHAFEFPSPTAGPWAGYTSESRAIMDFLLPRRNIALAVVFGPANNLLSIPQQLGPDIDTGNVKMDIPPRIAEFLGLEKDTKYSLDEVWEVAKDLPFVKQNNITKEDGAQLLGVGAANKPGDDDLKIFSHFSEKYKTRLDDAGEDTKRSGAQYGGGGFTPWLYYQYGAASFELDVWGVPKQEQASSGDDKVVTLEKLETMSNEDFLALGAEGIDAFLKDYSVPPPYNDAQMIIGAVKGGQFTTEKIVELMKQQGLTKRKSEKAKGDGPSDLQLFVEAHAPWAKVEWTPVTLPDGTAAEVGGIDQFVKYNPPHALLGKALPVHAETIKELSDSLAKVEILKTEVSEIGDGVYRVKVTAGNTGYMPSHTGMAKRAKVHLPIRLGIETGERVTLMHGPRWATSEQLAGKTGTLTGEWVVRAKKGGSVTARLFSDNAGTDSRQVDLQ